MIVTVLRGGVAPIAVMMIVTTRLVVAPCRLVVTTRLVVTLRRLVVAVLSRLVAVLSLLVAVLVLAVLRANRQWSQSGERERRHCQNNRLAKVLTHGDLSLCRMAGASMNACMDGTMRGLSNPLSVGTYGGRGTPGNGLKQSGCQ
jgi:hypothetical protein